MHLIFKKSEKLSVFYVESRQVYSELRRLLIVKLTQYFLGPTKWRVFITLIESLRPDQQHVRFLVQSLNRYAFVKLCFKSPLIFSESFSTFMRSSKTSVLATSFFKFHRSTWVNSISKANIWVFIAKVTPYF